MNGVIIVGHGSRRKEVNTAFKEFVEKLNKENRSEVVEAYFSFHEMTLNRRIEDFFSRGIKTVTIIPYFLFGGRHIDEDIPEIIEKLKKKYVEIDINLENFIGSSPLIKKVVQDIIDSSTSTKENGR